MTAASGGGGSGYIPGSTIPTPYGNVATPATYNPTYGAYNSHTWSRSTYFSTLLDKKSFVNLEGSAESSIFDKIEEFEDDLEITPKFITIFKNKGKFIYCYYDKDGNQLNFVKF